MTPAGAAPATIRTSAAAHLAQTGLEVLSGRLEQRLLSRGQHDHATGRAAVHQGEGPARHGHNPSITTIICSSPVTPQGRFPCRMGEVVILITCLS